MYDFTIANERGETLAFNQLGGEYVIDEISGLGPAPALVNTSEVALMDGQRFDSAKLDMRTLEVAFIIERDATASRLAAFRVLRPKERVRVRFKSEARDVYIDGYVSSVDVAYFEQQQVCTATIVCPMPYWRGAQPSVNDMSSVVGLFHFPFASQVKAGDTQPVSDVTSIVFGYIDMTGGVTVPNFGEASTGLVITLEATGAVSDPKIYDYATGDFIGVDFDMVAGDKITIDTTPGQKGVKLLRGGVETNIFNYLMKDITWLQLPYGGTILALEVASGMPSDLRVTVTHENLYEGV